MTETSPAPTTPTVVLVHGAFADASGWAAVIEQLIAAVVPVGAIVNPLRGINADSMTANVVGLVYISAFAPDEGETLQEIEGRSQDSILPTALRQSNYPVGSGSEMMGELSIDLDLFHEAFAADLPEEQTGVMARSQRPVSVAAFAEKTGAPAWRKLPSWAVVGTK